MTSETDTDDARRHTQAEVERLRAENKRLAELLDMAQDFGRLGVWERNPRTLAGHWDDHVFRFFGYAPGETPNFLEAAKRIHPDDRRPDEVQTMLGAPGNHSHRLRVLRPDGSVAHLHSHWRVIADAHGRAERVIGVMVDDTATHELAQRVKAEQEQLELALALSGIGVWRHDLNSGLVFHDERAQAMLGRSLGVEGVSLDTVRSWIHTDDLAEVEAAVEATLAGGGPVDTQSRFRHGTDGWRTLLTRRLLLRDAQGRPSMILGVALDVSEQQRRSGEALERLRVANERTSLALAAVNMGTWSLDAASASDDWDEQMFILRGLPPGTAVPDRAQRLALVLPEDRAIADSSATLFTSGAGPLAYDFRIRRASDGAVRTLASRSIALTDAAGRVTRRIGINWDVTEVRQAERAQRERELALRESRSKSALFARISHELRTPLNAVLGFTQLMQSENDRATAAEREQRLRQIETAGQRLLALVDSVLDLGEQGESLRDAAPQPLALTLADACAPCVAALAPAALARGVRILQGDLSPRVVGDERRLQPLLTQLLGNAVKFSRPHGVVALRSRLVGRDAVLAIEDSGPGIDGERARRLFEPFAHADGAAGADVHGLGLGVGIGLAIGQALAQRMGGRIELAGTGPEGSVFELWLPRADAHHRPPAAPGRAPALLYIEDNAVNMLIVRELLAKRPGVIFHGAVDGTSGVRMAREQQPTLVLIDMQLPDFDGTEVLAPPARRSAHGRDSLHRAVGQRHARRRAERARRRLRRLLDQTDRPGVVPRRHRSAAAYGLTGVSGARPLSTATRLSAASVAIFKRVATVALAMCGVRTMLGTVSRSGCTFGSPSNTSSAAAAIFLLPQRLRQRRVIDDTAAGDVGQRRGRLHQRELGGADGVMARLRVRHDDDEVIALAQQRLLVDPARAERRFEIGREPGAVVIDHLHAETERAAARDRLADAAHAEDAERGAMHVGAAEKIVRPALPLAAAQEMFALGDAPRRGEHQREAEVGGGFGQHVGGVGDGDAARRAGGHVDVVVADRHRAHGLELRAGGNQRGVDRLGGGDEDAVVALQRARSARRAASRSARRWW